MRQARRRQTLVYAITEARPRQCNLPRHRSKGAARLRRFGSTLLLRRSTSGRKTHRRGVSAHVRTQTPNCPRIRGRSIPGFGAAVPNESAWGIWSFPLPPHDGSAAEWGSRLAWTALQLEWAAAAERENICVVTHPHVVRDFVLSSERLNLNDARSYIERKFEELGFVQAWIDTRPGRKRKPRRPAV